MNNIDRISVATPQDVDPSPNSMKRNMDLIQVAIYVRVSSDRQDIHNSIEAQIDECTRYASAHNMIVVKIYKDEAASGRISSRPGFQEMIGDATGPDAEFHTILVWKLSRFSRNVYDSVTYQAILEQRGVELISITEPMDDSPAGKMIKTMIQALNAFYSDTLGEDVRRGLRKLVNRGFYPHNRTCYGFKLEKIKQKEDEPAHPKLVLDPPYSDIVRRLFLESIAGRTDKDIRVGLHDDGIPSPSGKDWWSPSTIDTILNKPIYAGYVNWGLSSKSGDEPILVPDHHEGIVAPEEFELAHQSRAGRAKTATHPREAGTDRMMSSLLKCRKCKESLQARPAKDPDLCYYICKTRRNETVSACDCPNIHSREFEPMFLKAVTEDILSPSNTKTIIEVVSRELEVPYEEQLSRLELIEKEILGVEKKEDRVMTAYEAGAYTVENFTKRMDPLRKQKAELNGNKATARKELNRDAVIVASPQMVIDFAKDMSKLIQHSQPKERKELLKRFIQCVWVEPGKATIVYRIPMPSDGPNPRTTKHELALDGEPVSVWPTARAGLDACGQQDWTDPQIWRQHKTVDLACGSGTLLAAMLTDMKRRAREQGAGDGQVANLQKLAVEETVKGLDINPISLQLAASQLTAGNHEISYRRMGLHLMPYGPAQDDQTKVSAGTLELLGQRAIVPRNNEMNLPDATIASQRIWNQQNDAELEDAVDAVKDARIIIMNPPFTNRAKMGEKFPKEIQQAIRSRVDAMEGILVRSDHEMGEFTDKNSIRPLFAALAEQCLNAEAGIMTTVLPTIALSATSGQQERLTLAERFHIHTILTCHQPRQLNISQGRTDAHESIIVANRHSREKPATRFISLDRMPKNDDEVAEMHQALLECREGEILGGWGEVSYWPEERIANGDWTPAIWRSHDLADAASRYANEKNSLEAIGGQLASRVAHETGRLLRGSFERAAVDTPGSFPILKSKGAHGQTQLQSKPDEYWIPKKRDEELRKLNGGTYLETDKILEKAGYLLITASQNSATARVVATASEEKYVGNAWMPVTGLSRNEAKAIAVFLNSTPGRLQIMRNAGKAVSFPTYSVAEVGNIRIPNVNDSRVRQILADCWNQTKDMKVPQFRDGECEVRRLWDEAVADAMGWDADELARLRNLLNQEPHVRGLGYNQYGDDLDEIEEEEYLEG